MLLDIALARPQTAADLAAVLQGAYPDDGQWRADGDPDIWAGDPCQLAVYTVQPTDPAQLAALLGYIWAGPMRGEWWEQTPHELVPDHCYIFEIDCTKSQRDDVPAAWDELKSWIIDGTPVRLTNRAGPGTRGTRALHGVGPVLLAWR